MANQRTADIVGLKFGRLLVLSVSPPHLQPAGKRSPRVLCRCECGNEKSYLVSNLKSKSTLSCGCLNAETRRIRPTTHGMKGTPTYLSWSSMKKRATGKRDPKNYSDRGISMCKRWHKFENFLADMGERPDGLSLDRIDNDKGYSQKNCRWATPKEQCRNKRTNISIEFNGVNYPTLSALAEAFGVNYSHMRGRLRLGWSINDALFTTNQR